MMFFVFAKPCGGVAANRQDFHIFGAGMSGNFFHQPAGRAAPAQFLRRENEIDAQNTVIKPVVSIGGMAVFIQFKAIR